MSVVTSKTRPRDKVAVRKSGHPAAFNKIRCPKCGLGYAVRHMNEGDKYTCDRCGMSFQVGKL